MRKIWLIIPGLIVAAALAFLAMPTGTAQADGGPHIKGWGATPDGCAACHRAHRGSAEVLLVEEQELLCGSCHGNDAMGSALNVMAGTNEADGGAMRAGGFESARIDTDDPSLSPAVVTILTLPSPGEAAQSKHSVDHSAQTAWAYGPIDPVANAGLAGFPLACGKCHDPHGNGNYRILRTIPADTVSTRSAVPAWWVKLWNDTNGDGRITTGEDVFLDDENPKQYSTTDYWNFTYTDQWYDTNADGRADTETSGRRVGQWCTTCHTRYLAPSGAYEVDSGDAIFKFRHATDPSTRSASATSPARPKSCLQCHVAHGSNATAGAYSGAVEQPNGGPGTGLTDSRLLKMNNRGICQKCHNK
ncbi:MAG: cytochrome c3 family protein [Dehalococcoidia bacterium]|nr:cytochrome c3 family protein [Dehalococcoidia bacterium]